MEGYPYQLPKASFLIAISFIPLMHLTLASRVITSKETNIEFIRTSCSSTTYPRLCIKSLSRQATIVGQDPMLLAHAALTVAFNSARSTATAMAALGKRYRLTRWEAGAMQDCVEELSDSVDEMRRSLGEMSQLKGSRFDLVMSDIQTWVSAALTDDDTCTEGFDERGMNGEIKSFARGKIVNVAHLTSNALALINRCAALHN